MPPYADDIAGADLAEQETQQVMSQLEMAFAEDSALRLEEAERLKKERDLVRNLANKFDWFKRERESYYDPVWNECYRMYRLQMPDERKSGEWRSKINVPYAYTAVEDAVPLLMEGLFGADRPFKLQGAGQHDVVAAHEKLLYWEVNELMNLEFTWELSQRQKAMYGTTCIYTGFKNNYRTTKYWSIKSDPSGDPSVPGTPVLEEKSIPEYVGPHAKVVDIYNLYPHPRSTPDNLPELFWQQFLTKKELEKSGRFKNLDKLEDRMATTGQGADSMMAERSFRTGSANSDPGSYGEKVFQILTYYNDLEKKVCSFTYIGHLLLEESDYPFQHDRMPLTFDRVTSYPFEFWGSGFIEVALTLMHEGNAIRNQRRDNVNLTVNAILEVRQGDIDDEEEDLIVGPGQVWHSRSGEAARYVQPPMITQDSYAEEARVSQDIARTTGLGGPISGHADPKVTSASGTQQLAQAQMLRLKRAIKNSALAMKEVVSQMVALNVQFLPLPEVFRVLGALHFKDYNMLEHSDLVLRSTITVQPAGSYKDPAIVAQQATNLLNVAAAIPQIGAATDWENLWLWVLQSHEVQDPAQLLAKPKGMDVFQSMWAMEENTLMSQGQEVPPAGEEDDHNTHMNIHRALLELRPDLWNTVAQHMVSHDMMQQQVMQLQQQQQLLAAGGEQGGQPGAGGGAGRQNGPGSAPAGNSGGLNPRRQSQPTSGDAGPKMKARMQPRLN